ncbi:hypothetical protein CL654_00870 [bacterium]|nr:hypothetical protein [bacterium]
MIWNLQGLFLNDIGDRALFLFSILIVFYGAHFVLLKIINTTQNSFTKIVIYLFGFVITMLITPYVLFIFSVFLFGWV